MKIIVSAGGTGGHIYPALAIIKEAQKNDPNLEVLYIGTHNRMETKIIPEHNIPYESIKIYGFSKKLIGRDIKNVWLIISSYEKCLKIMKEFKPDAVIGVGGYVTLPVIMAAKKLNIKTFIHEQNSIPGKTNKFLAKGVSKVFTSFVSSNKYFKDANVVCTGNPSGDNVNHLKNISRESLGFTKDKKLILITSGSLGSSALNNKLISYVNSVKDYQILMITGKENYDHVNSLVDNKLVKVLPYLEGQAGVFKNVDLIISRAGATTIAEIIASITPSILIPSPYVANNHQYYNALDLSGKNAAIMIEEKDLTKDIIEENVNKLLTDNNYYQSMKDAISKIGIDKPSKKIYDEIVKELK